MQAAQSWERRRPACLWAHLTDRPRHQILCAPPLNYDLAEILANGLVDQEIDLDGNRIGGGVPVVDMGAGAEA